MTRKKLILFIIAGIISISPVCAIAHDSDDGNEVKGYIAEVLQRIPEDVKLGSIKVGEDTSEKQLAKLATVGIEAAITTALHMMKGKVIKAELGETEGFLVWEVKIAHGGSSVTVFKIDAGDGRLLAAEQGEENAWWQFWD